MMDIYAWLILRVVYAWLFFMPIPQLLRDWSGTQNMVKLLFPFASTFFSIIMLCSMFFGAIAILLGIYGQLAGLVLAVYCLGGFFIHTRLAKNAQQLSLSSSSSVDDQKQLAQAIQLAAVGNITSGQKNIVLAAVACFFMLIGTGPYSLISMDMSALISRFV